MKKAILPVLLLILSTACAASSEPLDAQLKSALLAQLPDDEARLTAMGLLDGRAAARMEDGVLVCGPYDSMDMPALAVACLAAGWDGRERADFGGESCYIVESGGVAVYVTQALPERSGEPGAFPGDGEVGGLLSEALGSGESAEIYHFHYSGGFGLTLYKTAVGFDGENVIQLHQTALLALGEGESAPLRLDISGRYFGGLDMSGAGYLPPDGTAELVAVGCAAEPGGGAAEYGSLLELFGEPLVLDETEGGFASRTDFLYSGAQNLYGCSIYLPPELTPASPGGELTVRLGLRGGGEAEYKLAVGEDA